MAIKKSELYSTLAKCTNKIRSNCGLNAELFKNYVLIMLFLKYISDRKRSGELELIEIPDGCYFDDIVKMKGTTAIGDGINKIIGQIKDANPGVLDFIDQTKHDFCNKDLGKDLKAASLVITELVTAFQADGLDFKRNRAADDDLIGDAYEYLMRNFASQSGKDKGQFYTPTEVSRLMAILIGVSKDTRLNISAYDPTCGSGSLLLRTKATARPGTNVSLQGQEIDPGNVEMCNLNMILHGDETADIRWGDTLNNPLHERNGVLDTFDYIVSNPPFSLHRWMSTAKEDDEFGRWSHATGVPPQQYGDFAFLMHVVKSLKNATQNGSAGHAAVILPNGVLTRGGDEEILRRFLVDQQLISGIVALPPNTFYGTGIAGNIIVIDKNRSRDGILFIDGSRGYYKDEDSKNRLREQDLQRIADAWEARADIPHFARLASYDDIRAEGYNLNIPRYVAPVSSEIDHDIEAHLHGGIPEADVENLGHVWEVAGSLRDALFKTQRTGYVALVPTPESVADTIASDGSFMAQQVVFGCALDRWIESVRQEMLAVDKDCHPKEVIARLSESLLYTLLESHTLLDPYEVYDTLMNYWNETMQDDLYMISRDGWSPELIIPKKKNAKWSELACDLLPLDIVVETFFSEERGRYNELAERIYAITEQMKASTDGDDHEDEEGSQFIKLSEKGRLMSSATLKKLKTNLKKLNTELYDKILLKYSQLDEATVRRLVVNDKWLAAIVNRSHEAMDGVAQTLATEIKALHYRYADTLADIEAEVSEKESAVLNHLKSMGFTL